MVLGIEAAFALLGGCFILIGNGLILAILPLLAVLLSRRSARRVSELLPFRVAVSHAAVASLLIGSGVWLLVDVGFAAQNFICMAMR